VVRPMYCAKKPLKQNWSTSQLKFVSQAGSQMTPLTKNFVWAAPMRESRRAFQVALPFVYY
jgi:hypothetical protein